MNGRKFRKRFGRYVQKCPMRLGDLTGSDLKKAAKRWKTRTAGGADGILVDELRKQPDWLWEDLARVMNLIEKTGKWPPSLLEALGVLIPKSEDKSGPLDLRPLTLMSLVYRLWGAARIQALMAWQLEWLPEGLRGFRKDASTADIFMKLALKIEAALAENDTVLLGVSFDF